MFLLMAFVFGFGMAATILIGQAFGPQGHRRRAARDRHRDRRLRRSVAVGDRDRSAGYFRPALLHLLGTPAGAAPLALAYLRVIFIAMPAILILILLMMGLRGAGDALTPLWFMIVAVVLDSGLNPVFILGLGPAPRLRHRRLGDGDGDRQLCRPDRPPDLHLRARPAAAAARAASCAISCPTRRS